MPIIEKAALAKGLSCGVGVFVDHGHIAGIRELPLLAWPVKMTALMIEVAEALLKSRLGCTPYERVDECGAQVPVPLKKFEYFDIALGEFNPLSRSRSAHS